MARTIKDICFDEATTRVEYERELRGFEGYTYDEAIEIYRNRPDKGQPSYIPAIKRS